MIGRRLCAVALLGLLWACGATGAPKPLLAFKDDAKSVLELVAWLGGLPNLSRIQAVTGELGLLAGNDIQTVEQNGREVPNFTEVLRGEPVVPGSTVEIDYTVYAHGGVAATEPGGGERRAVVWVWLRRVRPKDGVLSSQNGPCIKKADMVRRFGEPINLAPLTDAGGTDYFWHFGTAGDWRTFAGASFGPDDNQCATGIWLAQMNGRAPGILPEMLVPSKGRTQRERR
jgi:hypothetical protein